MERPIIAVLEDQTHRVEWLVQTFWEAEIVYATSVNLFSKIQNTAEKTDRLILNILDHDLGISQYDSGAIPDIIEAISTSEDVDGLTGMRVAETLVSKAPTIIWTANAQVQWPMLCALRDRKQQAIVIPVYDEGTLRSVIKKLMDRYTKEQLHAR